MQTPRAGSRLHRLLPRNLSDHWKAFWLALLLLSIPTITTFQGCAAAVKKTDFYPRTSAFGIPVDGAIKIAPQPGERILEFRIRDAVPNEEFNGVKVGAIGTVTYIKEPRK